MMGNEYKLCFFSDKMCVSSGTLRGPSKTPVRHTSYLEEVYTPQTWKRYSPFSGGTIAAQLSGCTDSVHVSRKTSFPHLRQLHSSTQSHCSRASRCGLYNRKAQGTGGAVMCADSAPLHNYETKQTFVHRWSNLCSSAICDTCGCSA